MYEIHSQIDSKSIMMLLSVTTVFALIVGINGLDIWNHCPQVCTCQLQHLTETAIYRFIQNNKPKENTTEVTSAEFNDVFYDDNLESNLIGENQIVRSAICILQNHTQPLELIGELAENVEILTLIHGFYTGNRTIKFSFLKKFKNLLSLELLGPSTFTRKADSYLISEIDTALSNLKYLNLENILIKNSINQIQNFVKEFGGETQTFEYVQKVEGNSHPLTIVQQGSNEEILPYEKYKEQESNSRIPLFIGFKNLYFLRITHCELNSVHWTMFDGLHNLQYLILDKNNLRFIPPFAFYGTPNLKKLTLAHNNLLNIEITDLAGLLELEFLDLSYNNFSQLSELSLPPFPKLKLADFGNNPITIIFPNTFEVMNTTDSLIIGGNNVKLSLMSNSFIGLNLLKSLQLKNLDIRVLKRDLFVGMPSLTELTLTGNITSIEYDTFLDIYKLKHLILSNCNIKNISMDAFMGLENLEVLDLSRNQLQYLPPAVFDQLSSIKEIYLNNNKFKRLPRYIFSKIHVKLLRLNDNPWHCSCDMSEWKPILINRIKQKVIKPCEFTHDKGIGCLQANRFAHKYVYDTKVAPKCVKPKQYLDWGVFHVMRRLLKCPEYKPKIRKHHLRKHTVHNSTAAPHLKKKDFSSNEIAVHAEQHEGNELDNNLNIISSIPHKQVNNASMHFHQKYALTNFRKMKKYKKKFISNDVNYV